MKNFILPKIKQAIRFCPNAVLLMDDGRNISPAEAKKNFKAIVKATQRCEASPWRCAGVLR